MMRAILAIGVAVVALQCGPADAGSSTQTTPISKMSPLRIESAGVTADCTWPPGWKVQVLAATGGDGQPITYTLGGTPSGDFAISGNVLVVGPNGVAAGNCNTTENVIINANQP